ncbi:MAG: putative acyl-CoA dehydrogenase [Oleiphilaceae bacterium]|jgi:putative acyl-CoA dehydrogenase
MQNFLVDLILESKASTALSMRMARALDMSEHNEQEQHLIRIGTALGKYWICKRTPGHTYEAMECIGGGGVMKDFIMPRLFRESPIHTIWEESGNVQCLDMLRTLQKAPKSFDTFLNGIHLNESKHPLTPEALNSFQADFSDKEI